MRESEKDDFSSGKKVLLVNYVLMQWKELWNQVKKYRFLTRSSL